MSDTQTTPLAKLYQEMVDSGTIAPVAEAGRFTYPSMRATVPSITTYGVTDTRGLQEDIRAQLERSAQRNKRGSD
jgi:hypothetical protein